jgi:SAM-dependent methyltransferase
MVGTAEDGLARDLLAALDLPAGVLAHVHPHDEMLRFLADSGVAAPRLRFEYLRSAHEALMTAANVLQRAGRPWSALRRVLDFACGYGRLLRLLVRMVDPQRITASDIMPEAVEHVRTCFGVHGIVSAYAPDTVDLGGDYDFVWVGSLFTHLPRGRFEAWLARLAAALAPDGLLAFTTHGPSGSPRARGRGSGFAFLPQSENPRLDTAEYGVTHVEPEVVRQMCRDLGLEHCGSARDELWFVQDVHVVRRHGAPGTVVVANAPHARGRITLCTCDARGQGRVGGFAGVPAEVGDVDRVAVRLDGRHEFAAQLGPPEVDATDPRWVRRQWLLEGDLRPFGMGEHRCTVFAAGPGQPLECIDGQILAAEAESAAMG